MRRWTSTTARGAVAAAALAAALDAAAAERSYPLDCLADRVVVWNPVAANPNLLFGAELLPGIVLGPPGNSLPNQGSVSVASLGFGGSAVLAFDDTRIVDGPGPDFVVFENAFFVLPLPSGPEDDFLIFAEPGTVEVSADGVTWVAFPYDPRALQAMIDSPLIQVDKAEYLSLKGLAGLTPTFTGNWTIPDDPASYDPLGAGGVSGAGGDAFDLADVGLTEARYVRITDADTHAGFTGPGEGFDLDAVVALHARPAQPASTDWDGDGLSDLEEADLYGTNPVLLDSDGDGADDGSEVARCRDPHGPGLDPAFHLEPRIWAKGGACTELRWTFAGSGVVYDLLRGETSQLLEGGGTVELGPATCLVNDHTSVRWSCDAQTPAVSKSFYYVVRADAQPDYGRSSQLDPREAPTACP